MIMESLIKHVQLLELLGYPSPRGQAGLTFLFLKVLKIRQLFYEIICIRDVMNKLDLNMAAILDLITRS